jgi:hypothetical protein
MWTPCPKHLDEPVTILGLEPEDYGLVMLSLIVASLVVNALLAFACGAGVAWLFWYMKRGRAPGALIHALHRWDLVPIRGVLRLRGQRYAPW